MPGRWRRTLLAVALILSPPALAEEPAMHHAAGEFTVTLKPVSGADEAETRLTIDKRFTGDLVGSSQGQMMAGGREDQGVRVYVALETVTGTLNGKSGSFILAHRGTLSPAGQALSIIIVPGSGTGDLAGISGTADIAIRDGKHFYTLDYSL